MLSAAGQSHFSPQVNTTPNCRRLTDWLTGPGPSTSILWHFWFILLPQRISYHLNISTCSFSASLNRLCGCFCFFSSSHGIGRSSLIILYQQSAITIRERESSFMQMRAVHCSAAHPSPMGIFIQNDMLICCIIHSVGKAVLRSSASNDLTIIIRSDLLHFRVSIQETVHIIHGLNSPLIDYRMVAMKAQL